MTLFDKIHLAELAAKRATMNYLNDDRFHGEYETARAWATHRVLHSQRPDGTLMTWVSA